MTEHCGLILIGETLVLLAAQVSKLQQEGQTISKIRIKTENGETETTPFHYVKINQVGPKLIVFSASP